MSQAKQRPKYRVGSKQQIGPVSALQIVQTGKPDVIIGFAIGGPQERKQRADQFVRALNALADEPWFEQMALRSMR